MIGSSAKINDLRPVEIGPFKPSQAAQLAELLLKSRGVELGEESMEAFLDQVEHAAADLHSDPGLGGGL